MKKLVLILLYLVMLSSVFALRTCWTSGDPAEAAAREASAGTDTAIRMDLTDNEKNDLAALPDSFPAYGEFGAGMEFKDE